MVFRSGYQNYITEVGCEPPLRRFVCTDGSCKTCNEHKGGMLPPHDASARCESGKHNHCTCDVCF